MIRIFVRVGLMVGCAWLVVCQAGCGGDTGPTGGFVTRAVTFRVGWDSLTSGSGGANPTRSAIVTMRQANTDGSDIVFTITRPDTTSAPTTQTYTSPNNATVGAHELLVQFFTGSQPTGPVKMKIDTQLQVQQTGTTTVPISMGATPASLYVIPAQSVLVGDTLSCLYQVTDTTDDLVPVVPGAVSCTLLSGASNLSVSGVNLTGLAPGTATVVASLGALMSAPTIVSVTAP